jgi:hypothetical protein
LGSDRQVNVVWTIENIEQEKHDLVLGWHEIHSRLQTKGHSTDQIVPARLNGRG